MGKISSNVSSIPAAATGLLFSFLPVAASFDASGHHPLVMLLSSLRRFKAVLLSLRVIKASSVAELKRSDYTSINSDAYIQQLVLSVLT
mgnify:CR=1 FL=1